MHSNGRTICNEADCLCKMIKIGSKGSFFRDVSTDVLDVNGRFPEGLS